MTESLRQSESKRGKELELSEVQEMCLWNPGTEMMSRWAVRHADASGSYIIENQHEEDRMRDIHINKRESGAASEEQSDKLRKKVRFEQEAPNASASSDPYVALEHPASGETRSRPGSVLVQKSGHVEEVLERYRGEDAGDLKRIELDELVETWDTSQHSREVKVGKLI